MGQDVGADLLIRAQHVLEVASGDPAGTRELAEALLGETRAARHDEAQVVAMHALAQSHRGVLEHALATPLLDRAVTLAQRRGLVEVLGQVLATRGALRHEQGRTAAARTDLERAAALLRGRAADEVELQLAALDHNGGRIREAAARYATLLRRAGLGAQLRTRAANNLGLVEVRLGRHATAAAWLEEAATAALEVGDAYVAQVAANRAWAAVQAGRLAEGMARYDEATRLYERAGIPLAEVRAEHAAALAELRLLPEALDQARAAVTAFEATGVPLMLAEGQLRLAVLELAAGRAGEAAAVAGAAVRTLRGQGRPDWTARARLVEVQARAAAGTSARSDGAVARRAAAVLEASGDLGEAADAHLSAGRLAWARGDRTAAATELERAVALTPDSPVLVRVRGRVARALLARARGDDAALVRACRAGLRDLTRHRAALPSTELRALASGHGAELAALGLRAMVRAGSALAVLEWMELTRANALSAADPPVSDELEADMTQLRAVQAQLSETRAAGDAAPPDLLAAQARLEQQIRRRTWAGRGGAGPGEDGAVRTSTAELRRALGGRTLVEYDVLDGDLLAVVVERHRSRVVRLGPVRVVESELDALRAALRALPLAPPPMGSVVVASARALLERVAGLVVAPLALRAPDEVVVVPVGVLQRAPWSALLPCPVSVVPSAEAWRASVLRPARPGPTVLVAGPRLEAAVAEVHALTEVHPGARVLLPPESTSATVRAALDGAAVAHLACHGSVRADNPLFSSLELSDGLLTVHELDRRAGVPQQLVLAACDVGAGVVYPGNELLGFVGTLLARGTRGLAASTTLVTDRHVLPLVRALHVGLASGLTVTAALHAARQVLDPDDPREHAAWASFTAYGAG